MPVEMFAEPGIVIEPPQRHLGEHQVPGAVGTQTLERRDRGGAVSGMMARIQALVVAEKVPSGPPFEGEQTFVTLAHDQGDRSRRERRFNRRSYSRNEQLVLEAREVSTDRLQLHAIARQALISGRQGWLQPAVVARDPLH